jgi:hypothetical protein
MNFADLSRTKSSGKIAARALRRSTSGAAATAELRMQISQNKYEITFAAFSPLAIVPWRANPKSI